MSPYSFVWHRIVTSSARWDSGHRHRKELFKKTKKTKNRTQCSCLAVTITCTADAYDKILTLNSPSYRWRPIRRQSGSTMPIWNGNIIRKTVMEAQKSTHTQRNPKPWDFACIGGLNKKPASMLLYSMFNIQYLHRFKAFNFWSSTDNKITKLNSLKHTPAYYQLVDQSDPIYLPWPCILSITSPTKYTLSHTNKSFATRKAFGKGKTRHVA